LEGNVVLVSGEIGSGKTRACLEVLRRGRQASLEVDGVISPRRFFRGRLLGYDFLDCVTHASFSLARVKGEDPPRNWPSYGSPQFRFSKSGFERANEILFRAAASTEPGRIILVDEVGRLEMRGLGIYPGLMRIVENIAERQGVILIACRTEALNWLRNLVNASTQQLWCPGQGEELWKLISGSMLTSASGRPPR